jgi:hypothetical protein
MAGKRKKVTDKMVDEFVRLYVDKKILTKSNC